MKAAVMIRIQCAARDIRCSTIIHDSERYACQDRQTLAASISEDDARTLHAYLENKFRMIAEDKPEQPTEEVKVAPPLPPVPPVGEFRCNVCKRRFRTRKTLKTHKRKYHGAMP